MWQVGWHGLELHLDQSKSWTKTALPPVCLEQMSGLSGAQSDVQIGSTWPNGRSLLKNTHNYVTVRGKTLTFAVGIVEILKCVSMWIVKTQSIAIGKLH